MASAPSLILKDFLDYMSVVMPRFSFGILRIQSIQNDQLLEFLPNRGVFRRFWQVIRIIISTFAGYGGI